MTDDDPSTLSPDCTEIYVAFFRVGEGNHYHYWAERQEAGEENWGEMPVPDAAQGQFSCLVRCPLPEWMVGRVMDEDTAEQFGDYLAAVSVSLSHRDFDGVTVLGGSGAGF